MHMAQTIVVVALAAGFTILTAPVRAEETLIPKDMRFIGQGGSMMGLNEEIGRAHV